MLEVDGRNDDRSFGRLQPGGLWNGGEGIRGARNEISLRIITVGTRVRSRAAEKDLTRRAKGESMKEASLDRVTSNTVQGTRLGRHS